MVIMPVVSDVFLLSMANFVVEQYEQYVPKLVLSALIAGLSNRHHTCVQCDCLGCMKASSAC